MPTIDASLGVGVVGGVKDSILLLVGGGTTSRVSNPSDPNNVKIEKAIRSTLQKPTGELTQSDLENVTELHFGGYKLTTVKGLEKLTQLAHLNLEYNPDLTKTQIDELRTALPMCVIISNPTKQPLNVPAAAGQFLMIC